MATTPRLQDPASLVETLVEAAGAPARDRILVEAIQASGLAAGVALWRPLGGRGKAGVWTRLLARGDLNRAPGRAEIEARERGELPAELPLGRRLLVVGRGEARVALSLAGFRASEVELDRLEALLGVLVALDPPQPTGWMRRLPSLLPQRGHDPRGLGRALLEQLAQAPGEPALPQQPRDVEMAGGRAGHVPGSSPEPPATPPLPALRKALARAATHLADHGLAVRLVVRGAIQAPTRVPAWALTEVVEGLLRGIRSGAPAGCEGLSPLRLGLREEPAAWHLRIAPIPDGRTARSELCFAPLALPIGAPRPAEHALVVFLAAGGVLRAEGAGGSPSGWFLRLPKPRPGSPPA